MSKLEDLLGLILSEEMPDEARQHVMAAKSIIEAKTPNLEPADFAPPNFFKIPGYENYAINRAGEVYSRKRKNGLVSPWPERSGHVRIELVDQPGKRQKRYVHDLVLTTFAGPRPTDAVACHRNDVPTDNRLDNLYWGSRRDNSKDFHRNAGTPTLSPEKRKKVQTALRSGIAQADIAKAFDVSQSTISRIKRGLI